MAAGMFEALKQAGYNDNGSGAILNDILTINDIDRADRDLVIGR